MRIYDPLLFLFGHRGAIERIAGSYWSLVVGLVLVFTAGVARNYDHLIFTIEAEWFIGPIIASLISCSIVFLMMPRVWKNRKSKFSFLSFLSVYWMTAPCAWIYAIPVEYYVDILTATVWNIYFLAIVAAWRVALMIRCLCILTDMRLIWAFLSIMIPAALVAWLGCLLKGMSLIQIMGGVRSPSQEVLAEAVRFTTHTSFFLLVIVVIIRVALHKRQPEAYPRSLPWMSKPPFPLGALLVSLLILIVGIVASGSIQDRLINNMQLKKLIWSESYDQVVDIVNEKGREGFSPIHIFPPGPGHHYYIDEAANLRNNRLAPEWARQIWQKQYIEGVIQIFLRAPGMFEVRQLNGQQTPVFLGTISDLIDLGFIRDESDPTIFHTNNKTLRIVFKSSEIEAGSPLLRIESQEYYYKTEKIETIAIWPENETLQ